MLSTTLPLLQSARPAERPRNRPVAAARALCVKKPLPAAINLVEKALVERLFPRRTTAAGRLVRSLPPSLVFLAGSQTVLLSSIASLMLPFVLPPSVAPLGASAGFLAAFVGMPLSDIMLGVEPDAAALAPDTITRGAASEPLVSPLRLTLFAAAASLAVTAVAAAITFGTALAARGGAPLAVMLGWQLSFIATGGIAMAAAHE